MHVKSNLSDKQPTEVFAIVKDHIDATPRLESRGLAPEITTPIVHGRRASPSSAEAETLLLALLKDGPRPATDATEAAAAAGISARTLRRARERLGIIAEQRGRQWYVRLSTANESV